MSRSLTLPKARRPKHTSGSADASGLQEKQPDLDARTDSETESENVMARAREYIAASQKSLRQGTELVRQCREIVRQAKSTEPIKHDAKSSSTLVRPPLHAQKPARKRAR